MPAFDILFWFLILMLAVVVFAIEQGLAARHRKAVFTAMFALVAAAGYLVMGGEDRVSAGLSDRSGIGTGGVDLTVPRAKGGGDAGAARSSEKAALAERNERRMRNHAPFADCDVCPSMIPVPAGRFVMGSPREEAGRRDSEGPVNVTIPEAFAAGRHEVTRDQFAAFVEDAKPDSSTGCMIGERSVAKAGWRDAGFEQAGNHPVVCVAWRDAKAYVAWLTKKTGKNYRLLSEAEWEYAARANNKTPFWNGQLLGATHANFNRSRDGTIPIGYTPANSFGLHDVHGNAWEMVEDCWNPDLAFNPGDGRATQLRGDCSQRVIKGGGWDSKADQTRAGARATIGAGIGGNTVGFRVARELE